MEKYSEYKDSGEQWLGMIPKHWACIKTSYVFSGIGSGTTPTSGNTVYYEGGTYSWLQTGDLNDGNITETSRKITKKALADYSTLKIYPPQSLVIAMYGATIGKVGLLKISTCVNQACCVIPPSENILPEFAYYYLLAAKSELLTKSKGGGQPNISQDTIRNFKFIVPLSNEQRSIVSYLDKITGKIDEAIAKQQEMIDRLNERKQIIITQAVTRGLNPDVPMKDSGVDWIGVIPEHWETRKLKYIAKLKSGETINSESFTESGFPVYGGNGFRGYTSKYTNEGDYVLIGRQGALCGNVNYASGKFFASEHAIVVYSKEDWTWLGETIRISNLNQYSQSAAQPGLSVEVIKNIVYPYPPEKERKEISKYIRIQNISIERVINSIFQRITLLQERKQIIINEVVTGKVKV